MATAKSNKPGARRITDATIQNAKLPLGKAQHDIFDTVLPGFGLRVGKHRKSYFCMVRVLKAGAWKQARITLGTSAELALAEAREQARKAMELAQQGKDPINVRGDRKQAMEARSRDTYANVRADFLARYIGRMNRRPAPRTLAELERALSCDVLATWKERPIADITERDVIEAMDKLVERRAATMANRVLAYLRLLFKWSKSRRIVTHNPTADVDKPGAEVSRDRVLSIGELAAIWHASEPTQANHGDLFEGIVKLLMLTGQRRNEIAAMRWAEVVEDYPLATDSKGNPTETCTALVLPPERTKNARPHVVPLSAPAVEIIQARRLEQKSIGIKTPLVFTSTGENPFSGFSKSKSRLDARANLADPWVLHDLRRSVVTHTSDKLRIAPHVVEAIVNHISGTKVGVAGIYNRAEYLPERRRALDAWADYVMRHIDEAETVNVLELAR